jgi:2-polyprenyl-6-methoxyphenol hydroxylase-like FAD-dependent oxidoreductase
VTLYLGQKLEGLQQPEANGGGGGSGGGGGGGGGGGVELQFEGRERPVKAAVVVGADGYYSKVGIRSMRQRRPAALTRWTAIK